MHQPYALLFSSFFAAALLALGLMEVVLPGQFFDITPYFRRVFHRLNAWERLRLSRVLASRMQVEGASYRYIRVAGGFTMLMGIATFVPAIPYALPFAVACVCMAVAMVAAFVHVHREAPRRAAPLVQRRALRIVSPWVIPAPVMALLATIVAGTQLHVRLAAIGVAIATMLLLWIAWRASSVPALLVGDDPQLEYDVDEEVRRRRVNALVGFAGVPGYVLFSLDRLSLGHEPYVTVLFLLVVATFCTASLANRSKANVTLHFA